LNDSNTIEWYINANDAGVLSRHPFYSVNVFLSLFFIFKNNYLIADLQVHKLFSKTSEISSLGVKIMRQYAIKLLSFLIVLEIKIRYCYASTNQNFSIFYQEQKRSFKGVRFSLMVIFLSRRFTTH